MIDGKNICVLTGGICSDIETFGNGILKFRLAMDWAGQEKDSDNRSGYFDVTFFSKNPTGPEYSSQNAEFVARQMSEGKMKKGTQIQLLGRLVQDRFQTKEGTAAQRVVIVAESITYAGSRLEAVAVGPKAIVKQLKDLQAQQRMKL